MDYRLIKSFGYFEGRVQKHIPAGTVLVGGKNDALISKAFSMGAQLEPVEVDEAGRRTDGPTLEEWVKAGYEAEHYPPAGYAPRVAKEASKDDGAKDDGEGEDEGAAKGKGKGKK